MIEALKQGKKEEVVQFIIDVIKTSYDLGCSGHKGTSQSLAEDIYDILLDKYVRKKMNSNKSNNLKRDNSDTAKSCRAI